MSLATVIASGCSSPSELPKNAGLEARSVKNSNVAPPSPRDLPQIPENLKGKPFEFGIASYGTLSTESDKSIGVIQDENGNAQEIILDRTYLQFDKSATESDVERFLAEFKMRIVEREILPGDTLARTADAPTDTRVEEMPAEDIVTNNFVVAVNDDDVTLDKLSSLCEKNGLKGKFSFSSEKVAKVFQQFLDARDRMRDFKVRHVGLNVPSQALMTTMEYFGTSPDLNIHWATGGYYDPSLGDSADSRGNRLYWTDVDTSSSYSSWTNTNQGYGVKVAVIDNDFIRNDGELVYGSLVGDYGSYHRWNFVDGTNNINTFDPLASPGHGRRMASLIFSRPNDNRSVAGVAPKAFPFLWHVAANYDGPQVAAAVNRSIAYQADIINMSFASVKEWWYHETWYSYYTPLMDAYAAGIILVAGTGNTNNQTGIYPASYAEVMGVSAHDKGGNVAYMSDTGTYANMIGADIYAAGEDIAYAGNAKMPSLDAQASKDGTSGATALVSGACALYVYQDKIHNTTDAINKLRRDAWNLSNGLMILDIYYGTLTY